MKRGPLANPEAKRQRLSAAEIQARCIPLIPVDSEAEFPCVYLQELHPGITDGIVVFRQDGHKYFFPWEDSKNAIPIISTTTLIGRYFPLFAKEKKAQQKAAQTYDVDDPYHGKTAEQVLELWGFWSWKGSGTHFLYHCYFNKMPYQKGTWEKKLLKQFLTDHPDLRIYWTERLLADVQLRIGGSADAVFQILSRPGWFYLVDWKTCRAIYKVGLDDCYKSEGKCKPKPGQMCTRYGSHPITAHLENCNFIKYSIQLSIYRHLLESTENMQISGQAMIVVNPRQLDYIKYETEYMRDVVDGMLMDRALALM